MGNEFGIFTQAICCPTCLIGKIAGRSGLFGLAGGVWAAILTIIPAIPIAALIIYGYTTDANSSSYSDVTDRPFWIGMGIIVALVLALVLVPCVLRGKVRSNHNIRGNVLFDYLATQLCTCCSFVQMARETQVGNESFCSYPEAEIV